MSAIESNLRLARELDRLLPWCTCCGDGCDCGCLMDCVKHAPTAPGGSR